MYADFDMPIIIVEEIRNLSYKVKFFVLWTFQINFKVFVGSKARQDFNLQLNFTWKYYEIIIKDEEFDQIRETFGDDL